MTSIQQKKHQLVEDKDIHPKILREQIRSKLKVELPNFHGNFVTFSRSRTAALDLYHDDASLTSYAQGTHGGCFSNSLARDGALYSISGTTLRSMDAWVVER